MTDDQIFDIVRRHILDVLPGVDPDAVRPDRAMRDLGANSLDRMDVVIGVQDEMGINVPTTALVGVSDLRSLVGVLRDHA